jgi:hypothetical protein
VYLIFNDMLSFDSTTCIQFLDDWMILTHPVGQCATWSSFAGQLGDGSTVSKPSPTVAALSGGRSISAGNAHTCALLQDGTVWCWGSNSNGESWQNCLEDLHRVD